MTTQTIERTNYWTVLAVIIASLIALLMFFNVQSASAQSDSFNLTVKHGINGNSLGLDKDLPVDVYVNGEKAFTFSFKDIVNTSLPEKPGLHTINANLVLFG
jgi:YbbR domain-containing protein